MRQTLIAIILLFSSVLNLGAACYFYFDTKNFLSLAQSTEGTVVELIKKESTDGNDTYAPVFTFEDTKNKTHKVESKSSSYPAAYEVDEKVKVYYLEEEPSEAKLDGYFELWGAATILLAMASGSFIIGIIFLLRRR